MTGSSGPAGVPSTTSSDRGRMGSFGGGSGGAENGEPCRFDFETRVFGPVAEVVETLAVDDRMRVVLRNDPPQVALITPDGQQAGTLGRDARLTSLIDCLSGGEVYEADVISIDGSAVTVRVHNS